MARHFSPRPQDKGVGDVAPGAGKLFCHHTLPSEGERILSRNRQPLGYFSRNQSP
jgi:hypothetical protein